MTKDVSYLRRILNEVYMMRFKVLVLIEFNRKKTCKIHNKILQIIKYIHLGCRGCGA